MDNRTTGLADRWLPGQGRSVDGLIATFAEGHAFVALSSLVALFLSFQLRQQSVRDAAFARRIADLERLVLAQQGKDSEAQLVIGQMRGVQEEMKRLLAEKDKTILDLRRVLARYTDESNGA